ncbi:MAG: cysteine hydrolase [Xanthomonadaceae bacterium]|nr:cysteine hydrolase [Xanthomonadaceae bacterium]
MAKNDEQSFPDQSAVALLIIDTINDLEFAGGETLLRHALPMAHNIAALKRRARAAGIPAIYLNDNFGQWRSDFRSVVQRNLAGVRGAPMVRLLAPEPDDYFVLKPKHSGFFGTTLETLLRFIGARTLVLTGLTTEMCVLFTAMDAYMRDYALLVPGDCCAAASAARHWQALDYPQQVLKADTRPAAELPLERR